MIDKELKPINLILGHYGSGKTEIAVNLAFALRPKHQVALIDLDIVNPYFRSAEKMQAMEAQGIEVISCAMDGLADLPALPPKLFSIWNRSEGIHLVDLGGDPVGARVLARFKGQIKEEKTAVFLVVNARRPETDTVAKASAYLDAIEASAHQKVTHLINNTHLCEETSMAEILEGEALVLELAKKRQLKVFASTVPTQLLAEAEGLQTPVLPITIYMHKPWAL